MAWVDHAAELNNELHPRMAVWQEEELGGQVADVCKSFLSTATGVQYA